MRKIVSFCLLMCSILLLSGCFGAVPDQDTISVDKRGRVTSTIVEDFDKEFYDSEELFVGTVSEAEEEGYELPAYFVNPEENAVDVEELNSEGDVRLLILEEAVQVRVPGRILAVCPEDNVTVTGDKEAAVAEPELSYIIYR